MKRSLMSIGFVGVLLSAKAYSANSADKPGIPYEKKTLPNGLTVILHEDHSLPLVAVNIMVKVGSRFEAQGRTGFAHLFEHLMFMGTKNVPTKMFDAWMEAEGGWNNAWTSEDRTDYFDVGPAHALPLFLWLEADRFGSLADEMNQEKLNAQREVVRNERRQTSENEPYGKVELRLPELLYPEGHPYHHPVIGSHEDLQAGSVDDVKNFFRSFYVPNNASLVVAGDFNKKEALGLIEKYFAGLQRNEPPKAREASTPKLKAVVRETLEDNVNLPKVIMAWHSPAAFAKGDAELDLLSVVLQSGKASRLYKSLVYEKKLAQEVVVAQGSQDLSSIFRVEAIARPGVKLETLEAAIDKELSEVAAKPVSDKELNRAKNLFETEYVSKLQSLGERATMLNRYEMAVGDPGFLEKDLERYRKATKEGLLQVAKETLDPHARVIVRVVPKTQSKAGGAEDKQ